MDKKLKIGYITSSLSSYGGWDRYSKGIIESAAKKVNSITLTRKNANNENDYLTIHKVLPTKDNSFNLKTQLNVFFSSLKYFRGCDGIHSMIEPFAPGAALASIFLRIPFFLTIAGTYSVSPQGFNPKNFIKRQLMKLIYKRASLVATGSLKNIELIEKVVKLKFWKFIPFGVDPKTFYQMGNVKKADPPFIFTVGGVKPRKGADVTIEALGLLKDEFPDLHYKIVGETKSAEGFVNHLKELIKKHGLENRVHFVGRVTDDQLRELYNQCSIMVLAAQTREGAFEGFPMVYYEAQACGAPVVTTHGFGSEYVVKDGYNGFLVDEDDINGIAEAIRKILVNPGLHKEMIKNSVSGAAKNTWDHTAAYYINIYNQMIKGR